jgi:hypothetical protein
MSAVKPGGQAAGQPSGLSLFGCDASNAGSFRGENSALAARGPFFFLLQILSIP